MPDESVESTTKYISREKALSLIKDYGEQRYDQNKCSPTWTASQIASMLAKLPTRSTGFIKHGVIKPIFTGINISMGVCGNCGEKLIWYTEAPVKGCPHCFSRFK